MASGRRLAVLVLAFTFAPFFVWLATTFGPGLMLVPGVMLTLFTLALLVGSGAGAVYVVWRDWRGDPILLPRAWRVRR